MIEAGVSSFKIEGRLKDESYVKNVTAYYRQAIDKIIDKNPDIYLRSSAGKAPYRLLRRSKRALTADLRPIFSPMVVRI